MKQTQQTFSLQSDFSKLKMTGEAAMLPMYIDLAIYDLMADGRKRSVNEVVGQLTVLGYMRSDINRRMVVMLHKRNVFVQAQGGKGKVLYEMKKGAKRPDFAGGEAKTVDTVKESEIILRPSHDSVPVTFRKRRIFNISEMTMQNQTTQPQQTSINPLFMAGEADPANLHDADTPEVPPTPTYVVERTDPVRVALWKTMHDLQPYKYTDLCVLLDHIHSSSITYHLRKMVSLGMVAVDRSNHQTFLYQLVEGTPMPEGLEPYVPVNPAPAQEPEMPKTEFPINTQLTIEKQSDFPVGASAAAPQPQDAGETKPFVMPSDAELDAALDAGPVGQFKNPSEPEQPVTNLPDLVQAASDEKPKEVPLVEVGGIMVKGQHFSYKEARELLTELKAEGYGNIHGVTDRRVKKHVTVEWTVTIGLCKVTPHQANDIALSLIEELG